MYKSFTWIDLFPLFKLIRKPWYRVGMHVTTRAYLEIWTGSAVPGEMFWADIPFLKYLGLAEPSSPDLAWTSLWSFIQAFGSNLFANLFLPQNRLPGPTTRVSAAGSEAKTRGSVSANNRRSQSFNNYDKSKPTSSPSLPSNSSEKGKGTETLFWFL